MATESPADFGTLAEWLRAKTRNRGAQADLARALQVAPQVVASWLSGSIPSPKRLKALADWAGVDYEALRSLADGIPQQKVVDMSRFSTRTELGAYVGRKFEDLNDADHHAAMQILGLLDATLANVSHGDRPVTSLSRPPQKPAKN